MSDWEIVGHPDQAGSLDSLDSLGITNGDAVFEHNALHSPVLLGCPQVEPLTVGGSTCQLPSSPPPLSPPATRNKMNGKASKTDVQTELKTPPGSRSPIPKPRHKRKSTAPKQATGNEPVCMSPPLPQLHDKTATKQEPVPDSMPEPHATTGMTGVSVDSLSSKLHVERFSSDKHVPSSLVVDSPTSPGHWSSGVKHEQHFFSPVHLSTETHRVGYNDMIQSYVGYTPDKINQSNRSVPGSHSPSWPTSGKAAPPLLPDRDSSGVKALKAELRHNRTSDGEHDIPVNIGNEHGAGLPQYLRNMAPRPKVPNRHQEGVEKLREELRLSRRESEAKEDPHQPETTEIPKLDRYENNWKSVTPQVSDIMHDGKHPQRREDVSKSEGSAGNFSDKVTQLRDVMQHTSDMVTAIKLEKRMETDKTLRYRKPIKSATETQVLELQVPQEVIGESETEVLYENIDYGKPMGKPPEGEVLKMHSTPQEPTPDYGNVLYNVNESQWVPRYDEHNDHYPVLTPKILPAIDNAKDHGKLPGAIHDGNFVVPEVKTDAHFPVNARKPRRRVNPAKHDGKYAPSDMEMHSGDPAWKPRPDIQEGQNHGKQLTTDGFKHSKGEAPSQTPDIKLDLTKDHRKMDTPRKIKGNKMLEDGYEHSKGEAPSPLVVRKMEHAKDPYKVSKDHGKIAEDYGKMDFQDEIEDGLPEQEPHWNDEISQFGVASKPRPVHDYDNVEVPVRAGNPPSISHSDEGSIHSNIPSEVNILGDTGQSRTSKSSTKWKSAVHKVNIQKKNAAPSPPLMKGI